MLRRIFAILVVVWSSSALAAGDGVSEFYAGHKALEENRTEAAIQHFTQALTSKDLDQIQIAYVYHYRAVGYQKLEKHKEAIDDYSQALAVGALPKRVQAAVYYNRAIGMDRQGDYSSAVRDYTSAIALKPDYAEAYMNRGNAHRKIGDNQQALKDYEASSKYGNPMKHLPYFGRGLVLEEMGDTERAYDAFKIAASLAPADFIFATQKVADYDAGRIPATTLASAQTSPPAATGITAATKPRETAQTEAAQVQEPSANAEQKVAALQTDQDAKNIANSGNVKSEPSPEPAKQPSALTSAASTTTASARETKADKAETAKRAAPEPAKAPAPAQRTAEAKQPASKPAPAKPKVSAPKTASVAPSGFLVQVASYTSEAAALTESAQMKRKNADIFSGVGEYVIKADLGARGTYWRLQFGPFGSQSDGAGFCRKLKSRGMDCIVVRSKKS